MVIACLAHGIDVMGFFVLMLNVLLFLRACVPRKTQPKRKKIKCVHWSHLATVVTYCEKLMHYLLGNKTRKVVIVTVHFILSIKG